MKFLLDSCILIDHFNNINEATLYLKNNKDDCCISVITKAEVLIGFDHDESFNKAKNLLDVFPLIELNQNIIDDVIQLRREQIKKKLTKEKEQKVIQWKLPDAIQAAITIKYQLKLVTTNTKDFNMNQHNFVHIPYTI